MVLFASRSRARNVWDARECGTEKVWSEEAREKWMSHGKEVIFGASASLTRARRPSRRGMNGARWRAWAPYNVTLLRAVASRLLYGGDVSARVRVSPDLKTLIPFPPYACPVRRVAGYTLPRGCIHFVSIDRTWTMRKWKRQGETWPRGLSCRLGISVSLVGVGSRLAQLSDLRFSLAVEDGRAGGGRQKDRRRMDKYTEAFVLTVYLAARPAKIVAVNQAKGGNLSN